MKTSDLLIPTETIDVGQPVNGMLIKGKQADGRFKTYRVKGYEEGKGLTALQLEEVPGNRAERRASYAKMRKK